MHFKGFQNRPKNRQCHEGPVKQGEMRRFGKFPADLSTETVDALSLATVDAALQASPRIGTGRNVT
jgi:hypothetical protein